MARETTVTPKATARETPGAEAAKHETEPARPAAGPITAGHEAAAGGR